MSLSQVKTVNLRECSRITDYGLSHLRKCAQVVLQDCPNITEQGIEHLKVLRKIESIYRQLGECEYTDDYEINEYRNKLSELENRPVTVAEVLQHCSNLQQLTLQQAAKEDLAAIEKYCQKLDHIDINGGTITDTALTHLSRIKEVRLFNCSGISDKGLRNLTKCSSVSIMNSPNVTKEGIETLRKHVPNVAFR